MILFALKTVFYLVILLFGSKQIVEGSLKWTKLLGISSFVVGFLLVALGTSIPEMVTAFISAYQSNWLLVSGNLIGSNLFNTLIVLGACTLFQPISLTKQELKRDLPVLLFCTFSFTAAFWNLRFSYGEALTFIGFYFTYIFVLLFKFKEIKGKNKENYPTVPTSPSPVLSSPSLSSPSSLWYQHLKIAFQILLGFICLHFGGKGFIEGCLQGIKLLQWDAVKVGLILVALGTSLPELLVSLWSLWKKQKGLALGNILGSNLLNIWFILGLSRFFLSEKALIPPSVLHRDVFFLLGITFLVGLFLFFRSRLYKWQGGLLILLYGIYAFYFL